MSDHKNTSRLFLALWPDLTTQIALHHCGNELMWPSGASLVPKESLHLTLHFLGNVSNARLPELVQGLKVPFHSFNLSFSCPQLWHHGVVVMEPDAVPNGLLKLHSSLDAALKRLDLPTEAQHFRPHITLARHAHDLSLPTDIERKSKHWHVNSYALIQSQYAQTNRYRVVHRYFNS